MTPLAQFDTIGRMHRAEERKHLEENVHNLVIWRYCDIVATWYTHINRVKKL